jgi:hypothetical protein
MNPLDDGADVHALALTTSQLDTVLYFGAALDSRDQGPYLEDIAAELRGHAVLGDGLVHRVAARVAPAYARPPTDDRPSGMVPSKWSR